jgi:hypothetical protein
VVLIDLSAFDFSEIGVGRAAWQVLRNSGPASP